MFAESFALAGEPLEVSVLSPGEAEVLFFGCGGGLRVLRPLYNQPVGTDGRQESGTDPEDGSYGPQDHPGEALELSLPGHCGQAGHRLTSRWTVSSWRIFWRWTAAPCPQPLESYGMREFWNSERITFVCSAVTRRDRRGGDIMLIRVPEYFDRFRCLAGACPHTCCEAWGGGHRPGDCSPVSGGSRSAGEKAPGCHDRRCRRRHLLSALRRPVPFSGWGKICARSTGLWERRLPPSPAGSIPLHGGLWLFPGDQLVCLLSGGQCAAAGEPPTADLPDVGDGRGWRGDRSLDGRAAAGAKAYAGLAGRPEQAAPAALAEVLQLALAAQTLLDAEEDGQLPALAASWQPEQWETPPCGGDLS